MAFWSAKVAPSGETYKQTPGPNNNYFILRHALLGESEEGDDDENIELYLRFADDDAGAEGILLGTLSPKRCAKMDFETLFDKKFELYHTSKSTSVYFYGYRRFITDSSSSNSDTPSIGNGIVLRVLERRHSMRHWSVEVEPGSHKSFVPRRFTYVRLSLASRNVEGDDEPIILYADIDVDDGSLVKKILGIIPKGCAHIQLGLVLDYAFGLSHNSKKSSVFFACSDNVQPKKSSIEYGIELDKQGVPQNANDKLLGRMTSFGYWSACVLPGEPYRAHRRNTSYVRLTHASLENSERKEDMDSEDVLIYVEVVGAEKSLIGTLSRVCPQLRFDLIFDGEFTLSHDTKDATVWFWGCAVSHNEIPSDCDGYMSDYADYSSGEEPVASNTNDELVRRMDYWSGFLSKPDKVARFITALHHWSARVLPGEPYRAYPGCTSFIHLTIVALEKSKDMGNEDVHVYVEVVGEKKSRVATLSRKSRLLKFGLTLRREFILSHHSKNATVGFWGFEAFHSDSPSDSNDGKNGDEDDKDDFGVQFDNGKNLITPLSNNDDEAIPEKDASSKRPAESASKTFGPEKKTKVVTQAGGHKAGGDMNSDKEETPLPIMDPK